MWTTEQGAQGKTSRLRGSGCGEVQAMRNKCSRGQMLPPPLPSPCLREAVHHITPTWSTPV